MAKSNAERQAEYRARHLKCDDVKSERLNLMIDTDTKRRLERVCRCYGVTKRAMLERLLLQAEQDALDEADQTPTGQAEYFDGRLRLGETIVPPLQTSNPTDDINLEH